jgi:hypothetical protein
MICNTAVGTLLAFDSADNKVDLVDAPLDLSQKNISDALGAAIISSPKLSIDQNLS